jgi:hypothetical protein
MEKLQMVCKYRASMPVSRAPIKVFVHTDEPVEIDAPDDLDVEKLLGGSEVDFPAPMMKAPAGRLTESSSEKVGTDQLILVSHGRKADLRGARKKIDAARAAGRDVEVHVFGDLGKNA